MEEASVMMVGMSLDRIIQALSLLESEKQIGGDYYRDVADYSMPNVSDKIIRIIISYCDYVSRVIWGKS